MTVTLESPVSVVKSDLESELRQHVADVRFDSGNRALYATDASNYRQAPIGVVLPRSVDEVIATIETCRRFDAAVLSRGAGTSLAGQCCNSAVVVDFSRYMNRVLEIDSDGRIARVQPGVVLDDLRAQAERFHLTYGPDPATHNRCTLGGMIGNNSCGVHSVMAGMTDENIESLDVLTYDGVRLCVSRTPDLDSVLAQGGRRAEIYRSLQQLLEKHEHAIRTGFPNIRRRVSGYNLPGLLSENGFDVGRALVGSEGTCVSVLEATVKLVHSPPERSLVMLGFPDIYAACEVIPEILKSGPVGLEGFDGRLIRSYRRKNLLTEDVKKLPPGDAWLLVEFGGETAEEAVALAGKLADAVRGGSAALSVAVVTDHHEQERMWAVRESALGGTAAGVPGQPEMWPGWEDSAVAPEKLGHYLRDLRSLLDQYKYDAAYYGHFGEGCLHMRVDFDFASAAGVQKFRRFMEDSADLVVAYGGSLSGEHGDGQARAELLPRMFSPELMQAFGEFKAIWDPWQRMNPGKLVNPMPLDTNLRNVAFRKADSPPTYFRLVQDGGSFAHAALRCVGVGKCRREEAGTMCPSYMATREEKHSTRGRARLLFEMLQGDVVTDGWRSEAVKDALDLCLACKGCKGECPTNVDMATYKAEFLSHYYAGRIRPASAYAFGLMMFWARLVDRLRLAQLVNLLAVAPVASALGKRAVGMAPQRTIPRFASQSFKRWFARQRHASGTRRVVLWPDTWTNYFQIGIAQAAVEVLESAGYAVRVPKRDLCCGRPLYDFGMLGLARRLLSEVLDSLEDEITAGTPFVVLEPSCASVFREEMLDLFPDDKRAQALARQTVLLSELLVRDGVQLPAFSRTGATNGRAAGALQGSSAAAPAANAPASPGASPAAVTAYGSARADAQSAAIVHGHCHHKSTLGFGDEGKVLDKLGLDYRVLDSGCCGMAGAFGFEAEHYDVSLQVGERVLLPAVRSAPSEALIVADGFSCREQITQTTGRTALHLAEILQRALHSTAQTHV
jgi:FAD/FMN-containing dehydrogenase/Fe-S oxidoreductase